MHNCFGYRIYQTKKTNCKPRQPKNYGTDGTDGTGLVAPSQSPPQGERLAAPRNRVGQKCESLESNESDVGWQYVKELFLGQR